MRNPEIRVAYFFTLFRGDDLMEDIIMKDSLEVDSLDGFVMSYTGRYYFIEGWNKCMEIMNKK